MLLSIAGGVMALSGIAAADKAHAAKGDKEKCYGVVKTGANDCGAPGHSCAGQATSDNDPNEWVYMPKGLCERLTSGSLEPKDS